MKGVSRFENNLLRLLQFFLGEIPLAQALPLLEIKLESPRCLSRNAVELVQDMLAKGCVLELVRQGAWHSARHLRGDQIREGCLWQRTPPQELGLSFSRHTLDFLLWMTARKPAEDRKGWQVEPSRLHEGDWFFLHFVHKALHNQELLLKLLSLPAFSQASLNWLAFPDDYLRAGVQATPRWTLWTEGVGSAVLEVLQPSLAKRWVEMERSKADLTNWQSLRDLGLTQDRVLNGFLTHVEKKGRPDLARFLLQAAERVLTANATAEMWVGQLRQHGLRVADRVETIRGALALVRQLPRLQQWERKARLVGYFDDGYAASQLWKADWELYQGDLLTERAQTILRQLDPMRQTEG